jgi:hypothetical protein
MSNTKFIENQVKNIDVTEDDLNMLILIRNYLGTKPLPFDETVHGNFFLDKFIKKINDA